MSKNPDTLKPKSKNVACLIPIYVFLYTVCMFPLSVLLKPRNMCCPGNQFPVTQCDRNSPLEKLQHLQLSPIGLWLISVIARKSRCRMVKTLAGGVIHTGHIFVNPIKAPVLHNKIISS